MTYYAVDYLSLGYYACLFSSPIEIFRKCSYYSLATGPPEKSARKEKKGYQKALSRRRRAKSAFFLFSGSCSFLFLPSSDALYPFLNALLSGRSHAKNEWDRYGN